MPKQKRRKSKEEWTITDWEKWLWKIFSQYIRLRDCLLTTGTIWKGACVSCSKIYRFEKLQAGHFIPGRTRAILFDERCVNIQCRRCNIIIKEVWPAYYRWMQKNYNQEIIEELISLYGVDMELTPDWFEQSYKYYSWAVDRMRETKQLVGGEVETNRINTR